MNINDLEYKNQSLGCALAYAGRGWRVFPIHTIVDDKCTCDNPECGDIAKHPINHNGCHGATTDLELITAWHSETDGPLQLGRRHGRKLRRVGSRR